MQPNICNGRAEHSTCLQLITRRFVLSPLKVATLSYLRDTQLRFVKKDAFISTFKPFSCSFSTSVSPPPVQEEYEAPNPLLVSYLINSCGLTPEQAANTASRSGKILRFENTEGPDKVLAFFKSQGFTDTQVSRIVSRRPSLLTYQDPQEWLLPKMEFFRSIGFTESQLLHFLTMYPSVLTTSLEGKIIPTYEFLRTVLLSNKRVITTIRNGRWLLTSNLSTSLKPNINFLRKVGVPKPSIALLLRTYSRTLLIDHAEFCKCVDELRELGFDVSKSVFAAGLYTLSHKSNRALRERCIKVYKQWGWTDDDVSSAFRKFPQCMLLSEKKITQIMDLLVNKMGLQPGDIAKYPVALGYNFERRILPRCAVVRALQAKGFVKDDWRLSTVVLPSEKTFLAKFVTKFIEQAPDLFKVYDGKVDVFEE